jgi:FkbM family methyltransferase
MMYLIDRYFLKNPRLRRAITRLLEGDCTHQVSLLGETLTVHSIKEHGYLRSSRLSQSSALLRDELPVILNLAGLMCQGDTFVDIGANVGVFSLSLARLRRLYPNTVFYAFEANPDTFQRLQEQAQRLGIICLNTAVSDHEGLLKFVPGAVSHVFTTVENTSKYSLPETAIDVECFRLDQVSLQGDSLILKIDVEGQEMQVLEGAQGLFLADRVKAVYLDGYSDKNIEPFLLDHHFRLFDGVSLELKSENCTRTLAIRP